MNAEPNHDRHKDGPLVYSHARYLPPMALVSLNSGDALIAQAEQYERFAATESSLSVSGGREKFWRAAAALRLAAHLIEMSPGVVSAVCTVIDGERAQDGRAQNGRAKGGRS